MNNFTKSELEWLKDEIDHIVENYSYSDDIAYVIRDKIQAMIDNYWQPNEDMKKISSEPLDSECQDILNKNFWKLCE